MNYITVTGTNHYFGLEVFRVGQILCLKKDMDNTQDDEAIMVMSDAGVVYGYVANSVYSVARGTKSAGRIYDNFKETAKIEVCFITEKCVIAKLIEEKED